MKQSRVVVTGAAGFVGAHVCGRLLHGGTGVLGVDNFDPFYDREAKERALMPLRRHSRFAFQELDVADAPRLEALFRPTDVVVHLAARAGVRQSILAPRVYEHINVLGTKAVLNAAAAAGVRRVVFASSSSVYGDAELPFVEDQTDLRPRSPYAHTKVLGEQLCLGAARRWGMGIACLRLFSVFGPGQRPDQAVHRFTRAMLCGAPIDRFGSGQSRRDYTYVEDVARAVVAAVEWTGAHAGMEVFNVGSGTTLTLDAVIDRIGCALGITPRVRAVAAHPSDATATEADLAKSFRLLDYRPTTTFDEGLKAFLHWFEGAYGPQSRAAS